MIKETKISVLLTSIHLLLYFILLLLVFIFGNKTGPVYQIIIPFFIYFLLPPILPLLGLIFAGKGVKLKNNRKMNFILMILNGFFIFLYIISFIGAIILINTL